MGSCIHQTEEPTWESREILRVLRYWRCVRTGHFYLFISKNVVEHNVNTFCRRIMITWEWRMVEWLSSRKRLRNMWISRLSMINKMKRTKHSWLLSPEWILRVRYLRHIDFLPCEGIQLISLKYSRRPDHFQVAYDSHHHLRRQRTQKCNERPQIDEELPEGYEIGKSQLDWAGMIRFSIVWILILSRSSTLLP